MQQAKLAKLVLVRTRSGKINGLHARFYVWSGEAPPDPDIAERSKPIREEVHGPIDFIWDDSPAPGVPADNYMIDWRGFVYIPETGVYRFFIVVDDGAKLWLDGRLLIDAWRDQPPTHYMSEPVELERGFHELRLLYYNHDVFARILLGWVTPSGDYGPVPHENLYTRLGDHIVIRGVPHGYRVELRNGPFTRSAISKYGAVKIPASDIREPIPAYFRIYDESGRMVLETPVIPDVWGGDEYILAAR